MKLYEYENMNNKMHLNYLLFLHDLFVPEGELLKSNKFHFTKHKNLEKHYGARVLYKNVEIDFKLKENSLQFNISIDGEQGSIKDIKKLVQDLQKAIIVED